MKTISYRGAERIELGYRFLGNGELFGELFELYQINFNANGQVTQKNLMSQRQISEEEKKDKNSNSFLENMIKSGLEIYGKCNKEFNPNVHFIAYPIIDEKVIRDHECAIIDIEAI